MTVEERKHTLVKELQELVSALDRRVSHLERDGEVAIARDAAALKDKAIKRLIELGLHA